MSILVKNQVIKKHKTFIENENQYNIVVEINYDDRCNNGHNTFSITGVITKNDRMIMCGYLHNEIVKHFPELKKFIKWHLCSTDGPLFYIPNTLYWVKQKNWKNAKETAIWPKATIKQLSSDNLELLLINRKQSLMEKFQKDVESLGFVY
jgi:hypothetical protein